jgi:putative FmdB family regulatory protein
MPTYQYRCAKCREQFEIYQTFDDAPLKRHAQCGGKLDKVMGSVGIVLKGSGFYRNDHRATPARSNGDKRESEKAPANGDKAKEATPAAEKSAGATGDSNGSTGSTGSKESSGAGDSRRPDSPPPSKKARTKT